jgi:hypothetical protein
MVKVVRGGNTLSYKVLQPKLKTLIEFYQNKIDREGVSAINHDAARVTYLNFVRHLRYTYSSILYLCAEEPPDPDRKAEFTLVLSPLLRSICEVVILCAIFRESTAPKLDRYVEGGLHEAIVNLERVSETFGDDPDWKEAIEYYAAGVARRKSLANKDHIKTSKDVKLFPHFGQIMGLVRKGKASDYISNEDGKYLLYLDAWFYKLLSRLSHMSFEGLLELGGGFSTFEDKELAPEALKYSRSITIFIALTLLLAAFSEIEATLRLESFGQESLSYLWVVVGESFPEAKNLYDMRYRRLISSSKAEVNH